MSSNENYQEIDEEDIPGAGLPSPDYPTPPAIRQLEKGYWAYEERFREATIHMRTQARIHETRARQAKLRGAKGTKTVILAGDYQTLDIADAPKAKPITGRTRNIYDIEAGIHYGKYALGRVMVGFVSGATLPIRPEAMRQIPKGLGKLPQALKEDPAGVYFEGAGGFLGGSLVGEGFSRLKGQKRIIEKTTTQKVVTGRKRVKIAKSTKIKKTRPGKTLYRKQTGMTPMEVRDPMGPIRTDWTASKVGGDLILEPPRLGDPTMTVWKPTIKTVRGAPKRLTSQRYTYKTILASRLRSYPDFTISTTPALSLTPFRVGGTLGGLTAVDPRLEQNVISPSALRDAPDYRITPFPPTGEHKQVYEPISRTGPQRVLLDPGFKPKPTTITGEVVELDIPTWPPGRTRKGKPTPQKQRELEEPPYIPLPIPSVIELTESQTKRRREPLDLRKKKRMGRKGQLAVRERRVRPIKERSVKSWLS